MEPRSTTWVIKASKLCNMRCSYCYEWDELGNTARIGVDLWERVFAGIKEYHVMQNGPMRSLIVFHGGEPFALPVSYWRSVMALKVEILGEGNESFPVFFQSNALKVSDEMVGFLQEHQIKVGVSFDVVPGIRLNIAGQTTEAAIEKNIDRLREAGLYTGGVSVLSGHNSRQTRRLHDWFMSKESSFRVLPLFDGPDSRGTGFEISNDKLADAMGELFEYWIESGASIRVDPFPDYVSFVAQKRLGLKREWNDRGVYGDDVFLVNTNGDLYTILDAYDEEKKLGSLATQSMQEVLVGDSYWASIERDRDTFKEYCSECEYSGSCAGMPLVQSPQSGDYSGKCRITYNLLNHIDGYFEELGFSKAELEALLASVLEGESTGASASVTV